MKIGLFLAGAEKESGMIAYFNGQFLPREEIKVSPDDRGFLFADGVYEVIRAYGGKPFRMDEHMIRLARSLKEIRIDYPAVAGLAAISEKLIVENDLARGDYATIYIQITRGAAPRKHPFPDEPVPPTVYVAASPGISQRAKIEKGVKIILVPEIRWTRCDIKSIALLPNVLANQQAKENNAEEAVFVRDGVITEGSHTNFFMVFGGRVLTHPLNSHILPGITRDIIRDLCAGLKIPFQDELVSEKDLPRAEEMFLSGTSMEVTPVIQVEGWKVGKGIPGPLTVRLREAYKKMLDDFRKS
jgi:D-alanine transaminase